MTVNANVPNVLNNGVVLERETDAAVPRWVLETLSPRIWRAGVRINWR